ncbi:hypothetical protein F511_15524 [Dorcoceras hygrometricum]|uniref:Uncharacterized protein n=1 Tax=Dorcoceras hygrometricum TaxID=472368 RepID=A0A2Z7ATN3_9LAMI|nr:hypothetical protein F511_15524 [Dorcoceras hygrometricum]
MHATSSRSPPSAAQLRPPMAGAPLAEQPQVQPAPTGPDLARTTRNMVRPKSITHSVHRAKSTRESPSNMARPTGLATSPLGLGPPCDLLGPNPSP